MHAVPRIPVAQSDSATMAGISYYIERWLKSSLLARWGQSRKSSRWTDQLICTVSNLSPRMTHADASSVDSSHLA